MEKRELKSCGHLLEIVLEDKKRYCGVCMWAGPPSDLVEIRSLCDKILFVGQNVKMYHYIQLC